MAEIDVQQGLLDEIKEFISEKWRHSECELCGTDRWMIYSEPNQYAYLIAAGEAGMVQPFSHASMSYLPLSCSNCGNLRLVDAKIFDIWRRGRTAR